jgi:hypothetical protein
MLRAAGFEIVRTGRFLMLPTMLNGIPRPLKAAYQRADRLVWWTNDVLERAVVLNRVSSNQTLIARKPGTSP